MTADTDSEFAALFKPDRIGRGVRHVVRCSCDDDDLDDLRADEEATRARRDAAEAAMLAAEEAGDTAAYDRADIAFAQADDEQCLLSRRIDELEEEAGFDEMREQRRAYWTGVL